MSSKSSNKDRGDGAEAKPSSVKEARTKEAGASVRPKEPPRDAQVVRELKDLYYHKLLPIEKKYFFHELHHREILDAELGSKPTVLLLGQYSTGKTSFIKQLIGAEYPGMNIGPEPTTDKFVAVVHGETGKYIKGNALVAVKDLPFQGLHEFGETFLNKCEAAVVDAPLLKDVYIIDTPGVLSGEKQRLSRGYEFTKVTRWFAERSDLILLMFDAYKLDISDEFKAVIEGLHKYEDKVHCILNKADQLDSESLMRVYGALLWSMGKIFRGAEVTRIYVGSFRDGHCEKPEMQPLFDKDKNVLMGHLKDLPTQCGMRKVNEMVKRISLNRINLLILGHLRSKMPYMSFAAEATKKKLISDLQEVYLEVS
jgi:GTPase SAR1 family protein